MSGYTLVEHEITVRITDADMTPIPANPSRVGRCRDSRNRAKLWQPHTFTAWANADGFITRAALVGTGFTATGGELADYPQIDMGWLLVDPHPPLNPTVAWPADAPPDAVDAMTWLLRHAPHLGLPAPAATGGTT